MKKGVDISVWQNFISYAVIKDAGIEFAVLKISEGQSKDTQFENHYKGLKAQDIPVGVYVFSHADSVSKARTEAEYALDKLDGRELELPIFLDMEASDINFGWNRPTTDWALAFGEVIRSAGYKWGVYASESWWLNKLDVDLIKANGGVVWVAKYSSAEPQLAWDIWQHSDSGRIVGYNYNLDFNQMKEGTDISSVSMNADYRPTLRNGQSNSYVTIAQNLLNKAGFNCGAADGIFGNNTLAAVMRFQNANGLEVDGVIGAMTWAALRKYEIDTIPAEPTAPASDPEPEKPIDKENIKKALDEIKKAQEFLEIALSEG